MNRKLFFLLPILGIFAFNANAQVGIGTTSPNATAQLEVTSVTKGVLIPRMTSTQRTSISSPAEGLLVYQTDAPTGFYNYVSGSWIKLATLNDLSTPTIPSAYAANTSGSSISVVLGGTDIPLPNAQNFSSGFTINGSNTVITIANAGRYMISYKLNSSANVLASSRLVLNGSSVSGSLVSPSVSTTNFQSQVITNITAGSTLELQLFGIIGTVVLAGDASLSIVRLQ